MSLSPPFGRSGVHYRLSFLNDLDRIATRIYEPSDDDVVRARLRTLGVQEHRIQFDNGGNSFLGGK
jgi:hypothetical protein